MNFCGRCGGNIVCRTLPTSALRAPNVFPKGVKKLGRIRQYHCPFNDEERAAVWSLVIEDGGKEGHVSPGIFERIKDRLPKAVQDKGRIALGLFLSNVPGADGRLQVSRKKGYTHYVVIKKGNGDTPPEAARPAPRITSQRSTSSLAEFFQDDRFHQEKLDDAGESSKCGGTEELEDALADDDVEEDGPGGPFDAEPDVNPARPMEHVEEDELDAILANIPEDVRLRFTSFAGPFRRLLCKARAKEARAKAVIADLPEELQEALWERNHRSSEKEQMSESLRSEAVEDFFPEHRDTAGESGEEGEE